MPRPLCFILLFKAQLGRGISVVPTPPSLRHGPARDAQNLERDQRSAGEHLEGSTKNSSPSSQWVGVIGGPNLVPWSHAWSMARDKESGSCAHACRAGILWILWRCDEMAAKTGLWKTGVGKNMSSGQDRQGDEEGKTPSPREQLEHTELHLGMDKELTDQDGRAGGVRWF